MTYVCAISGSVLDLDSATDLQGMDACGHSLFLCRLDHTEQDVSLNCALMGFIQDYDRVPETHGHSVQQH